ncbi:MAG: hypothetical protein HYZ01_07565 [Ignavibacteriales bacterium]|nr:hypothetical protein [Ignavibacteriales bacterium]
MNIPHRLLPILSVWFLTIGSILTLSSCSSREAQQNDASALKGKLQFVKVFTDRAELDTLYAMTNLPLVVIENRIYLPLVPCAEPRRKGGENEQRNIGGDTEKRTIGGDTEKRNIGGDTEKRTIGGDTEKRDIGGDTEKRNIGGDTEKRNIGGDTEKRNIGGDTEKRNIGGDTEKRDIGGDTEKRNIGGDTEKRSIGGDTEQRRFGGASMDLECLPLAGGLGFRIVNPPAAKIEVFNGVALREVRGGIVEY